MKEVVHKHSAGGLIFKDDAVLLINWEPPRSSFDFPKGTIEDGESIESACIREVFEETGYTTRIVSYIGQTNYEYDWKDGTHHKKIVDYFLLELVDDSVSTPEREIYETFDNAWRTTTDAMVLLTKDIDKAILAKALKIKNVVAG